MITQNLGRMALLLGAGALLSLSPLGTDFSNGGWSLGVPAAYAKGGDDRGGDDGGKGRGGDDRGGDDRGRGSDDGAGDDRGGRGRGSDDAPGDDRGGRGRGSDDGADDDRGRGRGRGADDGAGDDRGGRGRGSDDSAGRHGNGAGPQVIRVGRLVEYETGPNKIEARYSTGWKEEIENGRYELKNPAGRTVRERMATEEDMARLSALR
ncbi:hypothetical protein [Mesobacterium pallidum]|uniref:hypothetical protein n=1 Tax=Mesobacterium pallidum TaxID=2872037 RepID=UPI001EE31CA8|nr:hypothetical protein [Mesobacterium pallidum]